VRQAFFQLMDCQSGVVSGAAPAGVATCDTSAPPPWVGWPRLSREQGPQGSQPAFAARDVVRGGRTWYPLDYPAAFACSLIPPPLSHGPLLRGAVPSSVACEAGRATGLPRSADVPGWVRSRRSAGGSPSAPGEFAAPGPGHVPFWPKRISGLRLPLVTTPTTLHLG
jgi:hypothetical protein